MAQPGLAQRRAGGGDGQRAEALQPRDDAAAARGGVAGTEQRADRVLDLCARPPRGQERREGVEVVVLAAVLGVDDAGDVQEPGSTSTRAATAGSGASPTRCSRSRPRTAARVELDVVVAGQHRQRAAEGQEATEASNTVGWAATIASRRRQRLGVGGSIGPGLRRRLDEVHEVAEQDDPHERGIGVEAPQQPHERRVVGEPVDEPGRPRREVQVAQEEQVAAVIGPGPGQVARRGAHALAMTGQRLIRDPKTQESLRSTFAYLCLL